MVITFLFLVFLVVIFLTILIGAFVAAFKAKTAGGRASGLAVALALLLGVPLAGLLLSLVAYRSTAERTPVPLASTVTGPSAPAPSPPMMAPTIQSPSARAIEPPLVVDPTDPLPQSDNAVAGDWRGSEMDSFAANTYPSYRSAITGVLNRLKTEMVERKILASDLSETPTRIFVTSDVGSRAIDLSYVSERLQSQFPDSQCEMVAESDREIAEGQLAIHLSTEAVVSRQAEWDHEQRVENGFLRLTVESFDRQMMVDGYVSEKPWVESFDRFVTDYPHRKFVVGYSRGLSQSEGQARRDATADAVQKAALELDGMRYGVIDDRHVVDRFAQKLSKPYGEVWREAILFELPDVNQLTAARATVHEHFEQTLFMQMARKLGVIVLLVAAVLICISLNWVTKGYYRKQVWVALSGLVFVGGLIMFLFLA